MLKAHVGAKCVSVRCSFFVARCSTSTARLSRAASLLAVDVREAEGTQPSHWLPFTSPQQKGRRGGKKERTNERKKEKNSATLRQKTKQKEDGRKGEIRSSGGASAFKFINKLDVLFVHLHNPRD